MSDSRIDVYPVGLLADLLFLARTVQRVPRHTKDAWRKLANGWRMSWHQRSYWNGYLAEPRTDNAWKRAGHGWTRRRALRSLDRHLAEVVDRSLNGGS